MGTELGKSLVKSTPNNNPSSLVLVSPVVSPGRSQQGLKPMALPCFCSPLTMVFRESVYSLSVEAPHNHHDNRLLLKGLSLFMHFPLPNPLLKSSALMSYLVAGSYTHKSEEVCAVLCPEPPAHWFLSGCSQVLVF